MAKFNNIKVDLTEVDANAFSLMGAASRAMRRAGVSADEIAVFRHEATQGDYDHVIQTIMQWVIVE